MRIIKDYYHKIFANKKRVLIVMPHPDDAELYCGATIARLVADGKKVSTVKMTYGDRGCKQEKISQKKLRKIRLREDRQAMKILGIREENNIYLGINDGEIENNLATIGKIAYQIRRFRPDIIITTNPEDIIVRFAKGINWVNHRDHRNCGKCTMDAAYPYARDLLFFPEQLKKKEVESHSTTEFLLVDYYDHPDLVYIDVSEFIDYRTKALAAHKSQYSPKQAQDSTDFFTKRKEYCGKRYDRLRHVIAD